jgi:hypothetical protein
MLVLVMVGVRQFYAMFKATEPARYCHVGNCGNLAAAVNARDIRDILCQGDVLTDMKVSRITL